MRAYRCQMILFWSLIMLEGKFEGDAGCGQSLFCWRRLKMELAVLSCSSAGSLARDRGLENPGFSCDGIVWLFCLLRSNGVGGYRCWFNLVQLMQGGNNNKTTKRNNTRCSCWATWKPVTRARRHDGDFDPCPPVPSRWALPNELGASPSLRSQACLGAWTHPCARRVTDWTSQRRGRQAFKLTGH